MYFFPDTYEYVMNKYGLKQLIISSSPDTVDLVDQSGTIMFSISAQTGGISVYVKNTGMYDIEPDHSNEGFICMKIGFIRSNTVIFGHDTCYEQIERIMDELITYQVGTPRYIIQQELYQWFKTNINNRI